MDTGVLIVGGGPTGLMLANQLARRGLRPRIIDRHSGPAQQTRALGVQARTLEIYNKLGIVKRALELGKVGVGGDLWANGRWMARIPLGDSGRNVTPYPYIFILGQDDNEKIMGERLREWSVAVEWNTELTALRQESDHVAATLKLPDGSMQTLTAAWVAGCDGGHSAVRELNGIGFPGAPYEHVFFVADTEATGSMVAGEMNIYMWRKGFHLFFPMRGGNHWRVVGILPVELRDREGVTFDDVVPSMRKEAGSTLAFRTCSWFSTYRIHHRAAARFRDRRCFVLGDAAHVHSPVGAQGMNTGLQDAYNLAWKLALVVAGKADAALLDSYGAEREPVAHRLLNTTDTMFRLIVADNWLAGFFRTQVFARIAAFAMGFRAVQHLAFRTVSQTAISYRGGPLAESLSGVPPDAPQAGDRFPWLHLRLSPGGAVEDSFDRLDDTRFNLLLFGQPAPQALPSFAGLLTVHEIADDAANDVELARVHIAKPSFYLLRPDGHVGLCGGQVDGAALAGYAQTRLRMRT